MNHPKILLLLLACAAASTVAAPSTPAPGTRPTLADWPGAAVKWNQMEGLSNTGGASFIDAEMNMDALTCDDFLCDEPVPIADLHFYGWSAYGSAYIDGFRVTFWSDAPASAQDQSHPDALLHEAIVGPADPADPLTIGWQETQEYIFRINLPKADWFHQQGTAADPIVYWVGIQGLMVQDGMEDLFYWGFRNPGLTWNDDAAFASDYFGYAPWANWGWQTDLDVNLYDGPFPDTWYSSADMAFALRTPEPGSLALLGLGAAALRRRRRRYVTSHA